MNIPKYMLILSKYLEFNFYISPQNILIFVNRPIPHPPDFFQTLSSVINLFFLTDRTSCDAKCQIHANKIYYSYRNASQNKHSLKCF